MHRTGYALLLTTALTGALGLLYWYVAARAFPTAAVGRAASLVSATALLSGIGTLTLSGAVMRFLPTAGARSRQFVLRVYGFAAALATLLTVAVLLLLWQFASPHSALRVPLLDGVLLCVGVMISTVFVLEDNVLTSVRAAVPWVPTENAAYGITKIVVLLLVSSAASYGAIYVSWILPMVIIVPGINALIFRRLLPAADESVRKVPVNPETRRAILRFVRGDASGGLFQAAWIFSLPLLVTATVGPVVNARFYVAFLISSSLDLVAANLSSALTVHGTHSPSDRATLIGSTLRRVVFIVAPVAAALVAVAPLVLNLFGADYTAATGALQLMLLASIPRAVVTVFYARCRLLRKTHLCAAIQAISAVTILAGSALAARLWGLTGVAAVLLTVQAGLAGYCLPVLLRGTRSPRATDTPARSTPASK